MTEAPAKYMVMAIHWLAADGAKSYVAANEAGYTDSIQEDDGTFTVVRLSDKPVQVGQVPYVGRKGTGLPQTPKDHPHE